MAVLRTLIFSAAVVRQQRKLSRPVTEKPALGRSFGKTIGAANTPARTMEVSDG